MRILCLDLSTHCGYAVLTNDSKVELGEYGTLHYEGPSTRSMPDKYPWSYLQVVTSHIRNILDLVSRIKPELIVIEETNKGKNRYSQKLLEFLHHELLQGLTAYKVVYLDTSHWRSILGIWMTKEQKRDNAKLSKATREAKLKGLKPDKKALGIKGKINKKHIAINHANATFSLTLKVKDNDAADAICLGLAYFKGATPSNGV